jgi:hypothetical protein
MHGARTYLHTTNRLLVGIICPRNFRLRSKSTIALNRSRRSRNSSRLKGAGWVEIDDPAIVSRAHIKSGYHPVARLRRVVELPPRPITILKRLSNNIGKRQIARIILIHIHYTIRYETCTNVVLLSPVYSLGFKSEVVQLDRKILQKAI